MGGNKALPFVRRAASRRNVPAVEHVQAKWDWLPVESPLETKAKAESVRTEAALVPLPNGQTMAERSLAVAGT